ncbi:dephospho-CoA kinase [Marinilactibacillus sp. Marseille-P9653]|uniref:dephospho-CoA kinase n=1 Tax=Marinilactibacillus sp. Marseille-P9653 TaxID=2866583 RepID=UPI001CE3DAAB|nr:dephospho-CoA kinase [Marinilactibacillus sp. Marseille-P9653]
MTYVLGLTGGIASGKSTVSRLFLKHDVPVVDADVGARIIIEPGTEALKKVQNLFGEEILLENGELNRKKLGELIFSDPLKRKQLNDCLSYYIREWILSEKDRLITSGHDLIVLDIPLLFESGYKKDVDEIMVVAVDKETQLARLMKRNELSQAEAIQRMESQMDLLEKVAQADYVIYNNGTLENTVNQVEEWLISKGYYST